MRDFTLPKGLTFGLVSCLLFELPTASGPKSARVYCGYRPGPTRVTLPSGRMMRTSERQLFRARFAWLCNWLPSDVCDGGHFYRHSCVSARRKKKKRNERADNQYGPCSVKGLHTNTADVRLSGFNGPSSGASRGGLG